MICKIFFFIEFSQITNMIWKNKIWESVLLVEDYSDLRRLFFDFWKL